ncbi:class I SAM-dependent methyltransferase [Desulfolithobacter sp.]
MAPAVHDDAHLQAACHVIGHIAEIANANFCVELWNGEIVPLGRDADSRFCITIRDPGVLGCILRRPTLETLLIQYATGGISYRGGDLITFYEKALQLDKPLQRLVSRKLIKQLNKGFILRKGLPLLLATRKEQRVPCYHGYESPTGESQRDDRRCIQFHYDLSNEFYELFLDPEMQYSCAYFTDWNNSLEQAQRDKLDMICRKLRLQPGDRFLDIGCGWGSLLCHAAKKYKVQAHGVTLSENQYLYARNKVKSLGLQDVVTVELRHYRELTGQYDKIASIGMYEHVGIANYPTYFGHILELLRPRGIFLNHGITKPAKRSRREFNKISPGRKIILKYVFPGSDLDHIGHTVEVMEACGFEIHDVESWREHYGLTTRMWCQRLEKNRERAVALVGEERYRMWLAYLAGVSFAFYSGSLGIFQTVATKRGGLNRSDMPPTRADLYLPDKE